MWMVFRERSSRNIIQLLKLRGKDQPLLLKWLERKEDRYTSHDTQNEIIAIMANHVIRDLVSEIRGGFFSIICDEYTDISNKEQLTICIRWVDKELQKITKISSGFTMYLTSARRL